MPERIGRYEVLAELGQGAMGVVYKARDPQLERFVAIKTLRGDLGLPPEEYADLEKRFYQEATAAGRLNHPHIVTVYDVVEIGGVPYIVMELLEGRTLTDVIAAHGPLAPDEAVKLIVQVCDALDYAHAHGVIHRDIKPGNIMVGADGVAKVSDFGIARVAGSSVTRTGVVVGTPAYMSPEQLRGRVPDGRSDLFSLGVVLYEALTGVNPFQCEDLTATLSQVVQVDPVPVREKNPAVQPALDRVTARTMAKEPDQRYPTAGALAQALTDAVNQPGSGSVAGAEPTVVRGRVAPTVPGGTRRRAVSKPSFEVARAIIGVTAGLISILGAAYSAVQLFKPAPQVGEVVAIIREAKTDKPVSDASVEILTPDDALVTTLTSVDKGQIRQSLREGAYRLRVSHPQFAAEVRTVQVMSGQTAQVRIQLTQKTGSRAGSGRPDPARRSSPLDAATHAVNEGVGAVQRFFRGLGR